MNFKQRRRKAHQARMAKKSFWKGMRIYRWYLSKEMFQRERILDRWLSLKDRAEPGSGGRFITEPLIYRNTRGSPNSEDLC